MEHDVSALRGQLAQAKRIVVKVGTRVLVQKSGRPDKARLRSLVKQLAFLQKEKRQIVLVTSGAIGAGIEALGLKKRPTNLPHLQMAASVGQAQLMSQYADLFKKHRIKVAQILLTHDDLSHRERHLNAKNTLEELLKHGILPIVNENDVVATDEIKFGDNDVLAALVALLIDADALVLLSSTNGFKEPSSKNRSKRVPYLPHITEQARSHAKPTTDALSRGGMFTKLEAARMASESGVLTIIADGRKEDVLEQIAAAQDIGTLIGTGVGKAGLGAKKKWLTFFSRAEGSVIVNEKAGEAIAANGKSLLPVGITGCEGSFGIGSLINIKLSSGEIIARGLTEVSSEDIQLVKGKRTAEVATLLGARNYDEVIHRNNMALLRK